MMGGREGRRWEELERKKYDQDALYRISEKRFNGTQNE